MEHETHAQRFGAGLTEAEVRRFQAILREQCGVELPLPEVWSRAIELLSLVEMLLEEQGVLEQPPNHPQSSRFLALDRVTVLRN